MHVLAIALAGALGAVLRYEVGRAAQPLGPEAFPTGTLLVNLSGALLLGFLATLFMERVSVGDELRLGLTVGLLGAYTTFSTFSAETLALLDGGDWHLALANVGISVAGGVLLAWAGQQLARA